MGLQNNNVKIMNPLSDRENNIILSIKKEIDDSKKAEAIKNLFIEEQAYLKQEFEKKLNKVIEEKEFLKSRIHNLEQEIENLEQEKEESIHVKSKIEELLPIITKLNKISDVAKEMMSKIFIILVEEQLQAIIKLADSHAQKKAYTQIEEESLINSLENLIHSDKLLKKAIKIAYKSENQKK